MKTSQTEHEHQVSNLNSRIDRLEVEKASLAVEIQSMRQQSGNGKVEQVLVICLIWELNSVHVVWIELYRNEICAGFIFILPCLCFSLKYLDSILSKLCLLQWYLKSNIMWENLVRGWSTPLPQHVMRIVLHLSPHRYERVQVLTVYALLANWSINVIRVYDSLFTWTWLEPLVHDPTSNSVCTFFVFGFWCFILSFRGINIWKPYL